MFAAPLINHINPKYTSYSTFNILSTETPVPDPFTFPVPFKVLLIKKMKFSHSLHGKRAFIWCLQAAIPTTLLGKLRIPSVLTALPASLLSFTSVPRL